LHTIRRFYSGLIIASLALGCATGGGTWKQALEEDTPGAYHRFLRHYPNAPQASEARERLAFTRLREKPSAVGYQEFREKYPDSPLVAELTPLVEEDLFAWTRARGTAAAYEEYLASFPSGRFSARARGNLEYLRQGGFGGRPAELAAFAERHPTSDFAAEAQRSVASLDAPRASVIRRVGLVVQVDPSTPGADRLARAFTEQAARHYQHAGLELMALQGPGDRRIAQVDALLTIAHREVEEKAEIGVGKSRSAGVLATTTLTLARRGDEKPVAVETFRVKVPLAERSDESSVVFGTRGKEYWDDFFIPLASWSTQQVARAPFTLETEGVAVAVDAHRAAVLYASGSFDIVDISNPAQPQVAGTYRRPKDLSKWTGIRLLGSQVVIFGENGLELIDFASGAAKRKLVLDRAKVGGVVAVEQSGTDLVLAGSRGIQLLTAASPVPEVLVDKSVISAEMRGSRLVFLDAEALYVASLGHLRQKTAEGQLRIAAGFGAERMRVADGSALVFGERGVMLIDVTNPAQPRLASRVNANAAGEIRDAVVLNGRLYVLGDRGLQVLDRSASRLLQSVAVAPRERMDAAGRHVAMIGDGELQVVDTTAFESAGVPASLRR